VVQALIGNTLIKQLQPSALPYEVRDTRLKGLILRVQPSGVMTFYIEWGRGKRMRLGRAEAMSADGARKRAKDILGEVYQGGDPLEAQRLARAHTFGSFIDEVYGPWADANIKTAKATVARLRASFAEFLNRKLADITPWAVEKWRAARIKAGTKSSTVNRDLDDLKSSLAKAVGWGHLEQSPIAAVKRARVDTARAPRFLSDDEEARLRRALDEREERICAGRDSANAWRRERGYDLLPDFRRVAFADYLKPLVILSLQTGLRRGEMFALDWGDVDLKAARITVHGAKAKSGTTRHIPLNSEALATLRGWRDQSVGSGLAFPSKGGGEFNNVRRSWEGALAAAGVTRFRWHDLRHSFASKLVMAGVDLNTVRELLGHSDYKMTLRYAHLAPEHKAVAVERLVAR
jgi:integrase